MKKAIILSLLLIPVAFSAHAETPEEKGLALANESQRRDEGFGDSRADLVMLLRNKQGEESTRRIRVFELEVIADGDKSLSLFDEPADVKGTAMLTHSHKTGADDQWLYLPALKRVKRIASANKSGAFMGSEFAYEDLSSQEVEKYTYKFLREEACGTLTCFVSERYPVDPHSGYSRQVVWQDKEHYRTQKIDYYDRRNSLLKTLTFEGHRQFLNKHWRAGSMHMVNHQTGKSTLLQWSNYKFRTGLKDGDFNAESLKRAR